jgi:fucose permease
MVHRYGTRAFLVAGGCLYVGAAAYTATRPAFVALVLLQLVTGYATGVLESVLNAHLATLPRPTTLLNRLHAFFGVGALLGPLLASWMLTFTTWPIVWLVLGLACVPLTVAVLATYPRRFDDALAGGETDRLDEGDRGALLTTALRRRGVMLAALLLTVYVGLELGIGNWAYSYLIDAREVSGLVAGYTVSGYWLGLTLGRFLLSPLGTRIGLSAVGLMYGCLAGVIAAVTLTWLVPFAWLATIGFVLFGFFLGPIFPTVMAVAPQLAPPRLVPTAIGVINAGSVVGGSALPWLAGATLQTVGAWSLLPFALALALVQLAVWWQVVRSMAPTDRALRTGDAMVAAPTAV